MPHGLAARVRLPEWMDAAGLDPRLHRQALRGLRRINVVSRTLAAVWGPVAAKARQAGGAPLSVLDVACGGGDVAIGLARRAARDGVRLDVSGCDISETALAHARDRAVRDRVPVEFFRHDVLAAPLPSAYDVVLCSLFLHHLSAEEAAAALGRLHAAARVLLVVSDLDRSRVGLALAYLGTRLLSRSPVVHTDGPRSVRAAFTPEEATALAAEAGLSRAVMTRHWPHRWRMVAEPE